MASKTKPEVEAELEAKSTELEAAKSEIERLKKAAVERSIAGAANASGVQQCPMCHHNFEVRG